MIGFIGRVALIFLGIAFFCVSPLKSQTFDFKTYDSSVGLPQNFVYALAQSQDGYIWIGTGEGLVRYNGINFLNYALSDSITEDFVRTLHVGKNGAIWVGHNNGTISIITDTIKHINFDNISSNPIVDICESPNGTVFCALQNGGLVRISGKKNRVTNYSSSPKLQNLAMSTIESISDNLLLVGTSSGLYQLTFENDSIQSIKEVNSIPTTRINKIVPRPVNNYEFWVATADAGFLLYNSTTNLAKHVSDQKLCLLFDVQNENIQSLVEDINGDLLLATWGDGVIRLFFDNTTGKYVKSLNFSSANGLNNNYVKDIICDKEGNYWFGTYGGGISALTDASFVFYSLQDIGFKQNKVRSVYVQGDVLWMGLESGLLKTDPYCFLNHEFYDAALGVPSDTIVGFVEGKNGRLWLATNNNGVYYLDKGQIRFKEYKYSKDRFGKQINDIKMKGDTLLLATTAGLYLVDLINNTSIIYNTSNLLRHNYINFVYVDRKGNIWLGPKNSGVAKIALDGTLETHGIMTGPVNVADMVEDLDGVKWLATIGKGIIRYEENGIFELTTREGLAKNYCYSITCDKNNKLWIAHWPGISSIDVKSLQIKSYRDDRNMNGEFYKVWKDKSDYIWFASSEGVIRYSPDLDVRNTVPPQLNFSSFKISGKSYPISEEINLPYPYNKSKYQFRFDFIGISYKNPEGVSYQYQLVKNDELNQAQWIDLGNTNYREIDFLPDGQYELKISAINADGVKAVNPIVLRINIAAPFWKTWWAWSLFIALTGYIIFMFIRYRERSLQLQKRMLEREVASQTILLRHQNFEIERKNQDITDSINYAKRIQSSILPPIGSLSEWFSDSFVFFAPRDIVSGDFYWFNQRDTKMMMCCADCTGHGVPGAFMSMIGSTLLTDIFKRNDTLNPGDFLQRLDEELKILLHQGGEAQATDGMDLSVVEIDLKTKVVRVATARRPVYLVIDGNLISYNGTRRSIGEYLPEDKEPKFTFSEYHCEEGDQIYLFSDGYTDQFGGALGKKFMTVGLKNLIQEISLLSMPDQEKIIESTFYEWKGDLEQVDDVIVMGIRI